MIVAVDMGQHSAILTRSKQYQKINPIIVNRAKQLEQQGIKALDALHISCAEALKSNVFITCDDKLLKSRAPQISVLTPPQFVVNLTQEVIKNGNA